MNIVLVTTGDRRWLAEDGVPTWGLGVSAQEVSEHRYHDDDSETVERFGWKIEVLVGPWLLDVYTGAAWAGWHGPSHHPQPFFERFYL